MWNIYQQKNIVDDVNLKRELHKQCLFNLFMNVLLVIYVETFNEKFNNFAVTKNNEMQLGTCASVNN